MGKINAPFLHFAKKKGFLYLKCFNAFFLNMVYMAGLIRLIGRSGMPMGLFKGKEIEKTASYMWTWFIPSWLGYNALK